METVETYLSAGLDREETKDVSGPAADEAARMKPGFSQAAFYRDHVVPCMEALRTPVDALEMMIDKRMWPIPAYSDLMYEI